MAASSAQRASAPVELGVRLPSRLRLAALRTAQPEWLSAPCRVDEGGSATLLSRHSPRLPGRRSRWHVRGVML